MKVGQRGVGLMWQQYAALIRKNAIVIWRQKQLAWVQLLSSLFFIFLIFCTDKAMRQHLRASTTNKNVRDPEALSSTALAIPPCEDKFYIGTPCYDFLWSGNSSSRIVSIVEAIMANNPQRPIPYHKVMSFETPDDVDMWLLDNPMRCPGALHFTVKNATVISYGIQTNSTPVPSRGDYEDPSFKFQIPLQIAAEREIARSLIGDPNFRWNVGLKEFAHPATGTFSVVGHAGPTFFLAMAMFGFLFQISSLVTEKELKLRQAMSIMGLYEVAYWFSWFTWEVMLIFISVLLTVLFGLMFPFDFFKNNSFPVLFLLFFLFQLNMLSFAFMISTFISKASSATTVGFSIFIIGFSTQLVTTFGFPYSTAYKKYYHNIWSLFPPNLFAKAVNILSDATFTPEDPGVSWSSITKCTDREPNCVITIETIYKWLMATFFVWFILAIYFDNILPNANGVRKSVSYFLNPGYWTGRGGSEVRDGRICSCLGSTEPVEETSPTDEDVLTDETAVKQQNEGDDVDKSVAVQVRGLTKTYPGTLKIGCCKCKRTSPYHAVKGIWVNLAKNQLFCLLGPNGAGKTTVINCLTGITPITGGDGKTTVINCLTGITPITGGDALIYGNSVRSPVGMANIRRLIGVCPQFDILWDALTAEEHLALFASIKGLLPSEIKGVVRKLLAEVKLTHAAHVRAGSFSGGMKRRLSVAISLIGDPKLVFLDEPTTGMDPITRRHVWDIIENAKKGRAIVLTTHSMEEADILSDRIAIMAKGKFRCIGTSIHLKSRFGTGYVANVNFFATTGAPGLEYSDDSHLEAVKSFFYERLGVKPKEENKAFLTFVIPRDKEPFLTSFFEELQDRESEFGISDIQLSLTTLEEVFLNIAKQAELESSSAQGNLVTLNLTSGASIQVPKGVRFVGIPGMKSEEHPRGMMVEVFWDIDEAGTLCISGHSPETPIPANVELNRTPSLSQGMSLPHGIPIGFVIEPSQILNQS